MDDAARRVRPANLRRLLERRQERERDAAAEYGRRLSLAAQAGRAARRAAEGLAEAERAREAGERAIYGGLAQGGALSPAALERRRASLAALTGAVASAGATLEEARGRQADAEAAAAVARRALALRSRESRKWLRIGETVADARRRFAERADEIETEDETSLRFRGGAA